ncbi:MAG TPA: M23 family metallopeptidase [Gammaproteobacteria bacterium]
MSGQRNARGSGAPSWRRGGRLGLARVVARAGLVRVALVAIAVVAPGPGDGPGAQTLYRYRDENGVLVFTDRRPPDGQAFEERALEPSGERGEVQLLNRDIDGGTVLVARNTYYAPVELAWVLTVTENVQTDTPAAGSMLLPARADQELMTLLRADPGLPMRFEYEFRYVLGSPDAVHSPEEAYRLPYALASSHVVSQAYPDVVTHGDPASLYAFDFAMPIGTAVHAARDGVVVDVASDYFEAGLDPNVDGPRANIVRVLHGDGTMALYAHLNWNSIRVVPGQRVQRGEHIADSGNTGFSSGPHLHFVVQRNGGGRLVSVPIEFVGPGGTSVVPRRGDRPVAY